MTLKQTRRAALAFLIATALSTAAATTVARAITAGTAETNTRIYAFVRAACSSSYWTCTNFFGPRCSKTGKNRRDWAQWACTEFIFREKRHRKFFENSHAQSCGVSASWDPYGHQTHGYIRCQYNTVENRPRR